MAQAAACERPSLGYATLGLGWAMLPLGQGWALHTLAGLCYPLAWALLPLGLGYATLAWATWPGLCYPLAWAMLPLAGLVLPLGLGVAWRWSEASPALLVY